MRPRLLDLFCGAGGAAMGYHRAGFDVIGVDINPQPHYPFRFFEWDALDYLAKLVPGIYDVIHASPPCQRYSKLTPDQGRHPDFVGPVCDALKIMALPYVVENVPGAPLADPIVLCGSMFGLEVRRHRLFDSNVPLTARTCQHKKQGPVIGVYGHSGGRERRRPSTDPMRSRAADWRRAMGIDWMNRDELAQAIPPAYTEFIGHQLLQHLVSSA